MQNCTEESSNSMSSSTKRVSFSNLVDVIDDSALEYVDFPPVLFESFDESDTEISITELTESSDQYHESRQSTTANAPLQQYSNFGDGLTSMSFNNFSDSDESIQNIPTSTYAGCEPPQTDSQVNLDSQPSEIMEEDYSDDNNDHGEIPKEGPSRPTFISTLVTLPSLYNVAALIANWRCSKIQPHLIETDEVVATTVMTATDQRFPIPQLISPNYNATRSTKAQLYQEEITASQYSAPSVSSGILRTGGVAAAPLGPCGMDTKLKIVAVTIALSVIAAAIAGGIIGAKNKSFALIVPPLSNNTICNNIENPDIRTGTLGLTFLNVEVRLLTQQEAQVLQDGLEESYNDVFGCIADLNSRRITNCTVPCNDRGCCELLNAEDAIMCLVQCNVLCDGCPDSEPLFTVAKDDPESSGDATAPEMICSEINTDDVSCAAQNDVSTSLSVLFCDLVDTTGDGTQDANDTGCGLLASVTYDSNGEEVSVIEVVEPTASPIRRITTPTLTNITSLPNPTPSMSPSPVVPVTVSPVSSAPITPPDTIGTSVPSSLAPASIAPVSSTPITLPPILPPTSSDSTTPPTITPLNSPNTTTIPTVARSKDPTETPTPEVPTTAPTRTASKVPTSSPIMTPTIAPTSEPTKSLTSVPTEDQMPTKIPIVAPTAAPTLPSQSPTTTEVPSNARTNYPSTTPTAAPTETARTNYPSTTPTATPTETARTNYPSTTPTAAPTVSSIAPTNTSAAPSKVPANAPNVSPILVFEEKFTGGPSNTSSFVYFDDTFRNTSRNTVASKYAFGGYETSNESRDVVFVRLGGQNNDNIIGMSGGWARPFDLDRRSNISISIVFQLEVARAFKPFEISEVLCSLDGTLVNNGSVEYLAQLSGDSDLNGVNQIGYRQVNLTVANVDAGNHILVIGGHLTSKNSADEVTNIRFDEVQLYALESFLVRRLPEVDSIRKITRLNLRGG